MKKIWEQLLLKTVQVSPELSYFDNLHFPANIRLDEDVLKMPWKRLSSLSSQDVFKTSWSRQTRSPYSYVFRRRLQGVQDQYICPGHMSPRCLQDVFFETSSRHLPKTYSKCLGKSPWRHFLDLFKMSF